MHLLLVSVALFSILSAVCSGNATSSFWCPDSCQCSASARIVDCSNLKLKRVPLIPAISVRLYLNNNEIDKLNRADFSGLQQLTYLILSNNKISFLSNDVFTGLESLQYLIIDGNYIEDLPQLLLLGLHQLTTLSIARNKLSSLPNGFLKNSKSLSLLNLQHNRFNETVLKEVTFAGNLVTLILNDNFLTSFSTPAHFPSLHSLHLASNRIATVSRPLLTDCSSLISLDLSNNTINEFDSHNLHGCENLQKLYLQHNKLTYLSDSFVGKVFSMRNLYLHGNSITTLPLNVLYSMSNLTHLQLDPFPCNCSLYPLAIWAHRHKVKGLRCWYAGEGIAKITSLLQTCNHKDKDGSRDRTKPLNLQTTKVEGHSCIAAGAEGGGANRLGDPFNDSNDFLSVLFRLTVQSGSSQPTVRKEQPATNKSQIPITQQSQSTSSLDKQVEVLSAIVSSMKEEINNLKGKLELLETTCVKLQGNNEAIN